MKRIKSVKEKISEYLPYVVSIGGLVVGVGIGVYLGQKYFSEHPKVLDVDKILSNLKRNGGFIQDLVLSDDEIPIGKADEDIFIHIAPAIEEAVMDTGLEKVSFERAYRFPIGENLTKWVTVTVENIWGD